MFAINHAATALVIKKHYPQVPMLWLLLSVQLVELFWVVFHFLGIEQTTTNTTIQSLHDIHLAYMPYSHSLASSLGIAFLAWLLLGRVFHYRTASIAIAIGVFSHICLDLVTHTADIPLTPFMEEPKLGLGLYAIPLAAFVVETTYGLFCWWIFRGSKALLLTILAFNLANISFFSEAITGPESLMANHPLWIVAAIAVQIVITLVLVGWFARPGALALEQRFREQPIS